MGVSAFINKTTQELLVETFKAALESTVFVTWADSNHDSSDLATHHRSCALRYGGEECTC